MAIEHPMEETRTAPAASGRSGMGYRLLYRLGWTPWDRGFVPPDLVELVTGPAALAPGRALDLGCGGGTQAIYLARQGWHVTAVDYVEHALERARQRAASAHAAVRWVQGDVTRLGALGLGDGYTLVFDFGCFHGLNADERAAYAAGVSAVTAQNACLLVFGFAPQFRGPAPRGFSRDELVECFGVGWELVAHHPARGVPLPAPLRRAAPHWYRLRRIESTAPDLRPLAFDPQPA